MDTTKETFLQFLARSKQELKEAVTNVPVTKTTYKVKRYCKLALGESKEDKDSVALKPKQKIIVEWRYENPNAPELVSIEFDGVAEYIDKYTTYWSDGKVLSWLRTNTIEEPQL